MTSTVFVDKVTPVTAEWLNEVNNFVFTLATPVRTNYTGDGTTTIFALPTSPGLQSNLEIVIDGLTQKQDTDYYWSVISPLQVTFYVAPPDGSDIVIKASASYPVVTPTPTDASLVTYQNPGSGSVQTTVDARLRETVSVKDFGAVGDGVTDDTAAIQAAATAAAGATLHFPYGTYNVTAAIDLPSNIAIVMDRGAVVQTATANISLFSASSKTNISIQGGKFKSTVQGTPTDYPSGILLTSCTYVTVDDCEFEGMQLAGIYLYDSSYCTIRNNYIHDKQGCTNASADTCDIGVVRDSTYNIIDGNRCFANTAVGILVQGASASTYPLHNKVINNQINEKTGYGIIAYQITAADTWTLISGNTVWDILGTHVSGASGSGIYVQTSGGAIVTDNHIRNCCRSTTSSSNAPGGISCVSNGAAREHILIANNHVDAPKWYGIVMGDSSGKFICKGNRVKFADGTNGYGILLTDSSNSIIEGNYVEAATTVARPGITVAANGASITGLVLSGNNVSGTDGNLLNITRSAAYTVAGSITGNVAESTGASSQALVAVALVNSSIVGNRLTGVNAGMFIHTCSGVRGSANNCAGSSANTFLSGGTCANTYFDASNNFGTNTGLIQNTAAGVIIDVILTGQPASGNWQVGDHWRDDVPVSATAPGGYCTVAGSPGTWKNEAVLA